MDRNIKQIVNDAEINSNYVELISSYVELIKYKYTYVLLTQVYR